MLFFSPFSWKLEHYVAQTEEESPCVCLLPDEEMERLWFVLSAKSIETWLWGDTSIILDKDTLKSIQRMEKTLSMLLEVRNYFITQETHTNFWAEGISYSLWVVNCMNETCYFSILYTWILFNPFEEVTQPILSMTVLHCIPTIESLPPPPPSSLTLLVSLVL